ncbi:hypothetical protein [Paenibacillus sp. Soil724D2]|uniref:hypothetical protein n=1 Tax=Paenibacillus sp. (strain Soil724D2) TaxID=1736392 RepID=UPI00071608F9|nr:hypothetical protein [Paenibacillus sp. Soil724D2]KRE33436.1 hypothetical protein ASG85_14310 [Paenibacillus sp. Soil724D2]
MARLIERDGKTFCVEVDGVEWEYTPSDIESQPEPKPTEEQLKIAQLEQQLAQTNADLAAVLELILTA